MAASAFGLISAMRIFGSTWAWARLAEMAAAMMKRNKRMEDSRVFFVIPNSRPAR